MDNLATILFGAGLLLIFAAATQAMRVLSTSSGQGDLAAIGATSPRGSIQSRIRMWLVEAELDWDLRDTAVWIAAMFTTLALVTLTMELSIAWLLLFVFVAGCALATSLVVRRSIKMGQFRQQFPEVVTIMARAVRAGLSIEDSFRLGEESARGRLRTELAKCAAQLSMGRSLSLAFDSFADRGGLREAGLLATILSVHQETGGPLAEALERLSVLLRDQLMFRQQVLAATSGGRFSAFVIAPAAPLLFCVLLVAAPEHVAVFFEKPLGRTFLAFGAILNVVGVLWIYYLVKPQN